MRALSMALLAAAVLVAPAAPVARAQSDDPDDWPVDATRAWEPRISAPRWVAPSAALPAETPCLASNNNVGIAMHERRLFLAWRTSGTHFASPDTRMHVVSSSDLGRTWAFEHTVAMGADVREPTLLSIGGRLFLHWFEAGKSAFGFEPQHLWRAERLGPARWSEPVEAGAPGEVPWELKVRRGKAWMTAYRGNHYGLGPPALDVLFKVSSDGVTWAPVDPARPAVYHGGVSEAAFELDEAGALWAVTRNEDGDGSGFGSHLATASPTALAAWAFPARSDPERYDSPRMFRHGRDLFLLARRDVDGPFDLGLTSVSFDHQRAMNLAAYSLRAKHTALYAIDREARRVRWIADLPSSGDTAFPSVCRTGAHTFVVANYTSPLDDGDLDRPWIRGQVSAAGTRIYLVDLEFVAK